MKKILIPAVIVLGGVMILGAIALSNAFPDYDGMDQDIADRLNEHNTEPIEFNAGKDGHAGFQGGFWVETDVLDGAVVSTTVNYPQIDYCHGGINASTTEVLDTYPMLEDIYWHTYDTQQEQVNDRSTRVSIYMTGGFIHNDVQEDDERMNKTEAVSDFRNNGEVSCGAVFQPDNIGNATPVFN